MFYKGTLSFVLVGILLLGCSSKEVRKDALPDQSLAAPSQRPALWDSGPVVDGQCKAHMQAIEALRQSLLAVSGERTVDNTVRPFNLMELHINRTQPLSELLANAHPDQAVRSAAEKCEQAAKSAESKLLLDRQLYDALSAVDVSGVDQETQIFVAKLLREYRRAGVDKDPETRKQLAQLKEQMVVVGQEFSRNIRQDRRFVEVAVADLKGLPQDFIDAHKPEANGKVRISTDYPDFFPTQTYLEKESVRAELYKKFLQRGSPANDAVLIKLLQLRHRYATMLGFAHWADYNAADKMAKDGKTIDEFITKVSSLARPRMENDLKILLKRKQKDDSKASKIKVWDRFFYLDRVRNEKHGVDSQEVRAYFEVAQVKQGILDLAQELFQVSFKKIEGGKTWHASVETYDIYDGEALLGRFYLDLYPRENKYGHAAVFPLLSGVTGLQLPAAALVTNFADPNGGKGPALMDHSEVTTFFHEFGHLMHQLLSGKHQWVHVSGITCEWDFVEAPSQLLEEWTKRHEILARFAKHHQTGQVIPEDLVKRMNEADAFGKGLSVMRQMFYAGLSFHMHNQDPKDLQPLTVVQDVAGKYSPFGYEEGTSPHTSFGHLDGYSSMYYTYMWSLVLAKDLFTRFESSGLLDPTTAMEYRRSVLEPGGAQKAEDMVKQFLGRESSFAAYQSWLSQ